MPRKPSEHAERDATEWMARELQDKAEPSVLAALARDQSVTSEMSSRERKEIASGRIMNSETARRLAAQIARDQDRRRTR